MDTGGTKRRPSTHHALLLGTATLMASLAFGLPAIAEEHERNLPTLSGPSEAQDSESRELRITGLLAKPVRFFLERRDPAPSEPNAERELRRDALMRLNPSPSAEELRNGPPRASGADRLGAHESVLEPRNERASAELESSGNLLRWRF